MHEAKLGFLTNFVENKVKRNKLLNTAIPVEERNRILADPSPQLNNNPWATGKAYVFPSDTGTTEYKDLFKINIVETVGAKFIEEEVQGPVQAPTSGLTGSQLSNLSAVNGTNTGRAFLPKRQVLNKGAKHERQTIWLPMPENFQSNTATAWEGTSLGVIGAKSTQLGDAVALSKKAFAGGSTSSAADEFVEGSKNFFQEVATVTTRETLDGIAGITGINVGGAISLAERNIVNPHQEVLFQGINFRDFTFSWRLQAKSESEVTSITNIIKSLKGWSAPTLGTGDRLGFFEYPAEFELSFQHINENGTISDNQYLPKIATCVLVATGVNYTSAGIWAAFRNGAPVDVQLDLSFKETSLITRDKVDEGY